MERRDARLAIELARRWGREGLMPAGSVAAIEARHAADAREDPDGESFGSGVLYGLGGILLGAAVFALLMLLIENRAIDQEAADDIAHWLFLAWGIACAAGAYLLDIVARKPRLGDALHTAALVAVTAVAFKEGLNWPFSVVALAFAGWTLTYRRTSFMVPFLALVAFNIAFAAFLFAGDTFSWDSNVRPTIFFGYAIGQVASLAVVSRGTTWPWPAFAIAGATGLMAATFLNWYWEVAENVLPEFAGDIEVYVAILMGAALAVGLFLREKGMVLAAALALAIDSIVFAFDVGDLVGGLVAILAVAGLLIWQAGNLRRYLREA